MSLSTLGQRNSELSVLLQRAKAAEGSENLYPLWEIGSKIRGIISSSGGSELLCLELDLDDCQLGGTALGQLVKTAVSGATLFDPTNPHLKTEVGGLSPAQAEEIQRGVFRFLPPDKDGAFVAPYFDGTSLRIDPRRVARFGFYEEGRTFYAPWNVVRGLTIMERGPASLTPHVGLGDVLFKGFEPRFQADRLAS